ncbi:MAG: phosphate ABC transporter substrate-binding protein [Candidatus Hydromicrobium sp.]
MAIFTSGCARGIAENEIIVAGSTSVEPFADKWAEVYMEKHPNIIVNVQGGGSSAGIQAAECGVANIGTCSRELKPEEKDLNEIIVAYDGLAIIVHPTNKIDDLTIEQIKQIFAGQIRNWQEFGGKDKAMTVVTREEGSGTRGAFQELVMKKERIFKGAIVQDSNGTVREIVANDPNAIGYISLGLVNDKVKALKLDGIIATDENIVTKRYNLVRPFLFVTKDNPTGEVKNFIDFVLSQEGQELIRKEGLIPVN